METTHKQVVTRFPPSPTGFLHVGSLRTALYNYLLARKHGGKFMIRVEDTDRERLVEGAVEGLIRVLEVMGLDYDEGPIVVDGKLSEKGEHGPYTQSARLDIYRRYVDILINAGHAYYCFCSKERLESVRTQQQLAKLPTKYDRTCCKRSDADVGSKLESGEAHVIRMRIPEGKTTFHDEIRGSISIDHNEIDDQVLMKSDGFPTYHLAVVVDDHLMGVTHVVRGEEWISSVPKHIMLYQWFQFPLPVYAHLPLILNADKSKLSKRQGDVAVEDYLKKGYLPEALINFVALLGFNPTGDREIYSKQELTEAFDLQKINKSGAVFDITKLNWMNAQYIKHLSHEQLVHACRAFVLQNTIDDELLSKIVFVERGRMERLDEINARIQPYLHLAVYEPSIVVWKKSDVDDAKIQLEGLLELIRGLADDVMESLVLIEGAIKEYIESKHLQNGNVLWPLRSALSGCVQSASPFELLWVLGKAESLARITFAINLLAKK